MSKPDRLTSPAKLTPAQESLRALWEEHVKHEFATHNTEDTLDTMVQDAYVNHIPVMTGGVGHEQLRRFYSQHFIPPNAAGHGNGPDLKDHRDRSACG
jgi:carboxymethylenebutenolidase